MGAFDIHFVTGGLGLSLGWFWWFLIWLIGCAIAYNLTIIGLGLWNIIFVVSFIFFWGIQGENWPMVADWWKQKPGPAIRAIRGAEPLPPSLKKHVQVLTDKPDLKKIQVAVISDFIPLTTYIPSTWCGEISDPNDPPTQKEVQFLNGDIRLVRYKVSTLEAGITAIRGNGVAVIEVSPCAEPPKEAPKPEPKKTEKTEAEIELAKKLDEVNAKLEQMDRRARREESAMPKSSLLPPGYVNSPPPMGVMAPGTRNPEDVTEQMYQKAKREMRNPSRRYETDKGCPFPCVPGGPYYTPPSINSGNSKRYETPRQEPGGKWKGFH